MDPDLRKDAVLITPEGIISKIRRAHVASTANAKELAIRRTLQVEIVDVATPTESPVQRIPK